MSILSKKVQHALEAQKRADLERAQSRKEASILRAQDNKQHAIMLSSSMRMAVDMTLAENGGKDEILKWRQWFIDNWNT